MRWLAFIFALSTAAMAATASRPAALEHYAQTPGDASVARSLLREVPGSSNDFPWVLAENARLSYQLNDWSAFFGTAAYARRFYPRTSETQKIRMLEVLALMRHCRWDDAKALTREAVEHDTAAWKEALGFLSRGLSVGPSLPVDQESKLKVKPRETLLPRFALWKTGGIDPRKLPVDRLRRQVEPMCEDLPKGASNESP